MKLYFAFMFGLVTPALAMAQDADGLVDTLAGLVNALIPIAFSAALLFFFYGLAMFILKTGEDKEAGKSIMVWGVIALFVMTSVFGIIQFLGNSLGIGGAGQGGELRVPIITQ